jgi:hypothetical protein
MAAKDDLDRIVQEDRSKKLKERIRQLLLKPNPANSVPDGSVKKAVQDWLAHDDAQIDPHFAKRSSASQKPN